MPRALGLEVGAIYTVVGPRGDRAVFNDPTSPDFAGFLSGDDGVTGLEGGAIRENADQLPAADGGVHGAFYSDRLTFTLKGIVDARADGPSAEAQSRILRATNALRGDAVVEWVPSTIAEGVRVAFRAQQRTRITGRRPKTFLIAGVAEDPLIYSRTLRAQTLDPAATGGGGLSSPMTSPLTSTASVAGQALFLNDGTADTWPVLRVYGPATDPVITNATTGGVLAFTYTLGAGEFLEVRTNPRRRRILLNGTTSRWSARNFAGSTAWWPLVPGSNDLRIGFATYSAGARLDVEWRDAWAG